MTSLQPNEHDYLFKILLIGDSGVGKTCLLLKFTDDVFQTSYISTIGVDFRIKTINLEDGKVAKLQMWDTAGQERFRTITSSYYRGAHGVIIVYDVGDRRSFEHVPMWVGEVERYAKPGVPVILVGNKTDLVFEGNPLTHGVNRVAKREVSKPEAQAFAEDHKMAYTEVSAKSDSSIVLMQEVFRLMVQKIRGETILGDGWLGDMARVEQKDDTVLRADQLGLTPGRPRRFDCCSS